MPRKTWLVGAAALVLCFVVACGSSESEEGTSQAEGWLVVQEQHAALMALRDEAAAIRAEIDAGVEGDEDTGLSPEEALLQVERRLAAKDKEIADSADEFSGGLVEFINEHAGYEGDELNEIQAAAIILKSAEDIELAREYVAKGGDYSRALDILGNTVLADPDNLELLQEVERLKSLRYMDEDRFGQVMIGMSEGEVRVLLGHVFHRNVREYEEQDTLAWFYPKEEGAAAAVFFRESGDQFKVYNMDFEAVKPALERVK